MNLRNEPKPEQRRDTLGECGDEEGAGYGSGVDAAIWRPFWVSVFLDLPAATFDTAAAFWAAVTGFPLSARRGDDLEFATLVPGEGDAYLRVQRVRDANPRLHLDVHVTDVGAAAAHAVELGAEPVADAGLGYRVLCSPGGLVFCLVRHTSRTRPAPTAWPDGHRSVVDQVALDLTLEVHAVESAFWAALLDQPVQQLGRDEFSTIDLRPELPLRFLLQRLDERTGPARAHLDLSADDVAAEVARHLALGAVRVRDHDDWTVLRDPAGLHYCVTRGIRW